MVPHHWRPLAHEQNSIFKCNLHGNQSFQVAKIAFIFQITFSSYNINVCFNLKMYQLFHFVSLCAYRMLHKGIWLDFNPFNIIRTGKWHLKWQKLMFFFSKEYHRIWKETVCQMWNIPFFCNVDLRDEIQTRF